MRRCDTFADQKLLQFADQSLEQHLSPAKYSHNVTFEGLAWGMERGAWSVEHGGWGKASLILILDDKKQYTEDINDPQGRFDFRDFSPEDFH